MGNLNLFGAANWVSILSIIFILLCLYSVLTFFQHLKNNDERLIKQSKLAAVFCLAVALLVPAFYNLYIYSEMMR
ncbi:hypothetical protein AEA09_12730 [Lysinibacillus contaminans]|uniref:Uncharacterized protein n=1 Tax=Lysinibacillus contaminans TaxID=1293441 RepID=A0ABR5K3J1_9BACI|nr:hypothetical protein [Lysinibacillus contaminans]KOS69340.1 hypothetical protein AEA09_12730 [Lysinibacillus contaminans]